VRHRVTDELNERALDCFDDVGVEPYVAAAARESHLLGERMAGIAHRPLERDEEATRRTQPQPFRGIAQLAQFAVHLIDARPEATLDSTKFPAKLLSNREKPLLGPAGR
jgi:hypothetical protein